MMLIKWHYLLEDFISSTGNEGWYLMVAVVHGCQYVAKHMAKCTPNLTYGN